MTYSNKWKNRFEIEYHCHQQTKEKLARAYKGIIPLFFIIFVLMGFVVYGGFF